MCKALGVFTLFILTQFLFFYDVPGFHFDEAWQALFSVRILNEPDFWPLSAMNSYTSPVLHYVLAGVFFIFGPTLTVMRLFFGALNLISFSVLFFLSSRVLSFRAALWFGLLFSLVPFSVHLRRFYIEVTSFHLLCFSLVCLGVYFKKKKLGAALLVLGYLAGVYSHVLFLTVAFSLFLLNQRLKLSYKLLGVLFLCTLPISLRMSVSLHKASPMLLSVALLALSVLCFSKGGAESALNLFWKKFPKSFTLKALAVGLSILLFPFVFLFWNGNWPYAQATGNFELWWIPLNTVLALVGLARYKNWSDRTRIIFLAFLFLFSFTSLIVFKQAPRYYTLSLVVFTFWLASTLSEVFSIKVQSALAATVLLTNSYFFIFKYIEPFQKNGARDFEFKFLSYHDNARDFRPYQKAWEWVVKQGCQNTLTWVEDDRFLRQVEFLKLSTPPPSQACPWSSENLFFSHIPDYPKNTIDPPFPNVKLLAHEIEWGDLSLWIRK